MSETPSLYQAAVLGVVQGLTEFLPVSSSGHLIIVPRLLGWPSPPLAFDVAVHFGTLISLLCVYGRDLGQIAVAIPRALFPRGEDVAAETVVRARLGGLILLACVPAGIAGVLFKDFFESLFHGFGAVGAALLVTGGIIWVVEGLRGRIVERPRMSAWDALWVGVAQACAIVPGISRSGSTIAAGLARGLGREEAPRFAFLVSVPVIVGATVVTAHDLLARELPAGSVAAYVVGALAAAIAGWAAINVVLRAVVHGRLRYFSFYCWAVGAAVVVLAVLGRV